MAKMFMIDVWLDPASLLKAFGLKPLEENLKEKLGYIR